MGKRVAGICYVKIDGDQFDVAGDVACPLSDVKRETKMAAAGPAGYIETATKPYIKVKAVFGPNFPIEKVRTATDMTVTAELANGKVYTVSSGWLEGETEVKGSEGEVDLEFGGMKGIWQ
ncbi:MAG TPA: phage tail tube protein [Azonexus sp.]|nr:phage tail tube protein [Azonexus sp.]